MGRLRQSSGQSRDFYNKALERFIRGTGPSRNYPPELVPGTNRFQVPFDYLPVIFSISQL